MWRKGVKLSTSVAASTPRRIISWKGGGGHIQERQKPSHTAVECLLSLRVVHHAGMVIVSSVGEALKHIHSLDDCNCFKRPSVFQVLAAREVANEYLAWNLCAMNRLEDQKKLFAAGGR